MADSEDENSSEESESPEEKQNVNHNLDSCTVAVYPALKPDWEYFTVPEHAMQQYGINLSSVAMESFYKVIYEAVIKTLVRFPSTKFDRLFDSFVRKRCSTAEIHRQLLFYGYKQARKQWRS
ncbi:Uncharacterised protein g11445 [Pycnogonum litorale]